MNTIINKFLLAGDKFMPEMHLRQPQFTYSACGPFTKHKQRIQKFKVGLSPSKKNCVICFIESSLKLMKNAFYFILEALFVLKIFQFLP